MRDNTRTCRTCGHNKPLSEYSPCRRRPGSDPLCRACDAQYHKNRYAALSKRKRREMLDKVGPRQYRRYKQAQEQGMCSKCKRLKSRDGKTTCRACGIKAMAYQIRLSAVRMAAGFCGRCGKRKCVIGKKACRTCLLKVSTASVLRHRQKIKDGLCVRCYHKKSVRANLCRGCYRKRLLHDADLRTRVRAEIYEGYGRKCACCGLDDWRFLSLDHVNNDGFKHRRKLYGLRVGATLAFYRWAKRNGFPKTLQLLCFNCNMGKNRNKGICPHGQETGTG